MVKLLKSGFSACVQLCEEVLDINKQLRVKTHIYIVKMKVKLLSHDGSLSGFSIHGIFQARVLEWIAVSFSRESSRPRNPTRVSHIAGRRFTAWATREALINLGKAKYLIFLSYSFLIYELGINLPLKMYSLIWG